MIFGWLLAFLFLGILAGGIALAINGTSYKRERGGPSKSKLGLGIAASVLGFALFLTIPFSFHQVETGEVAVVKELGEVKDVRGAGVHFDFWMTNTYIKYDTKIRSLSIETQSYSQDAQTMTVQMSVHYQIDAAKSKEIASKYGTLDVLENRITGKAIQETKDVLTQRGAEKIISERNLISQEIATAVENAIGSDYYVDIQTVALTNIDFSDAYEKAVEDKMVAEQVKKQKDYENEAREAAAETDKKVKELQAEADAIAKEKAAEAEANAIAIKSLEVARMLGLTVLENDVEIIKPNLTADESKLIADYLKYIEYLSVWDGKLPEVVTDGSGIIINP